MAPHLARRRSVLSSETPRRTRRRRPPPGATARAPASRRRRHRGARRRAGGRCRRRRERRRHRRHDAGTQVAAVEVADDLFQHEGDPRQRRVEGRGEATAAPAAAAPRRRGRFRPSTPARADAAAPLAKTVGPSRPRLDPPPRLITPATSLTQRAPRQHTEVFPIGDLELWMPLPAASGRTPAAADRPPATSQSAAESSARRTSRGPFLAMTERPRHTTDG